MTYDEDTQRANEILREVFGKFAGKPKRPRAKPHRCFDCGKVTKYVRCPDCSEKRRNRA